MLIPIRTDNHLSRRPIANHIIIGANVVLFVMQFFVANYSAIIRPYLLDPAAPQLEQFFSSMFLHGGWAHIIGNMIFLWVFGNAVNDRFGNVAYTAFYLAGGVLSGIGYLLLSGHAPVLGASGAIAGVTGCYLVLFPRVRVTLLAWLFWVLVPIEISSLIFLGFQFVFNIWASFAQADGGVAYVAHVAGYFYGIGVAAILLTLGLLPRDVYDLPSLWKAHRRRWSYRRMVAQGYDPFRVQPARAQRPASQSVAAQPVGSKPRDDTAAEAILTLRRQISQSHGLGDFSAAAGKYLELVALADDAVLPRQQQLDISNQLMSEQRHSQAADAYERLIEHYPNYEHIEDIRLMLGIIYGRYLRQAERARENLRRAIVGLHDSRKLAVAKAELNAIGGD